MTLLRFPFFVALALLAVTPAVMAREPSHGHVSIVLTSHGIPHVMAHDYRGLGYGDGYAMAANDICGLAATFATYSGERALRLGESGNDFNYLLGRRPINNATSDFSMRLMIDGHVTERADRDGSSAVRSVLAGYAQGFNHYLATHPNLPAACRDTSVRPITVEDVQRRIAGLAMLLSSGLVLQQLYDAAPPHDDQATAVQGWSAADLDLPGSNGYAFGKDVTDNHRGLLLGNPHFFWDGPNRFVEIHLTLPGVYDVMGVTLPGLPLVALGFNQYLAWTHTVSTDHRGVVYRLSLDPMDPTHYLVDGRSVAMTRKLVTIQARTASGAVETRTHEFWLTDFGPVISGGPLRWTREHAYVLYDANQANDRLLQQWLEIGQSRDVGALRHNLERTLALPWMNTIAADRAGRAFYGDLSIAPNLPDRQLQQCTVEDPSGLSRFFAFLDGSRGSCRIAPAANTPQRDILSAKDRPATIRSDFVANSNGSHWLTNAAAPLEGFPAVIGPERTPQSLRTRQGQIQVDDRLHGRDGLSGHSMSAGALEQILFSGRSLQAELIMDPLLETCRREVALDKEAQRGCAALANWDGHYALSSRGAHLFTEFVNALNRSGTEDLGGQTGIWRVPFDPADPVHTPRDFNASDPGVFPALSRAVRRLDSAGVVLDARLSDVQFVTRAGVRIPLPGGATYSALHATLVANVGLTEPILPSNSYIQVVSFDASGPVAEAILASSQTPDPESPFYDDQTWAYSRQEWIRLPFSPRAIDADRVGAPILLELPSTNLLPN
jgi:acyl-homoserine-lactone acylase